MSRHGGQGSSGDGFGGDGDPGGPARLAVDDRVFPTGVNGAVSQEGDSGCTDELCVLPRRESRFGDGVDGGADHYEFADLHDELFADDAVGDHTVWLFEGDAEYGEVFIGRARGCTHEVHGPGGAGWQCFLPNY